MKSFVLLSFTFLVTAVYAQQGQSGGTGGTCVNCNTVQDGSTVLGPTYSSSGCGLNYVAVSQKVGQRFSPPGVPQPCTLAISGIPSCAIIEKAYIWADASGAGGAITASVTNPSSVTNTYPMTIIGQDIDKCWSYPGTDSYRADVTSAITGDGNYIFSGFPVLGASDVDGFAMMIIYRDPTATYQGHIEIWDGAVVIIGNTTTQTITGMNVCGASTNQRAFLLVADLQGLGATLSMNNSVPFTITEDWWNYVDQPTATIPTSQTSTPFTITSVGDCFNFLMMGLYYQTTTCTTCVPQATGSMTLASSATNTCVINTGSVTTTPTGGVGPYSYVWQPGGATTQTVNGLPPGSYTVTVTDATGCAVAIDTVVVPVVGGPTAQFSLNPSPVASFPGQLCMTDQTVGGASWIWVINGVPSATTSSYCYTVADTNDICVTLIVADSLGCSDSATACVTVLGEALISIPNVFTPNADGSNDVFEVTWTGLTGLTCELYDRWGVLIYKWDGLTGKWDGKTDTGKLAVDGVYYYIVHAVTTQGDQKELTGFVHLIRG
ncbi:MAG TPA: gliding motility-associated C-terminal domain-containing protein [Bacteroidia bacterium]|nr:gliding motility-associated C-terminal domain-containing protein [Bacteroidia bacterium]